MNKDRRLFLNQVSVLAGIAAFGKPMASAASITKSINTLYAGGHGLTVFSTNDLHGKLNPISSDLGGLMQIKKLIKKQETSGPLFDAGDFFDARQSLSAKKGMICAMNDAGYHAVTPGYNELAQGQDYLAALAPLMNFSMVNCNYEFNNTLRKFIKPYIVINSGRYKIGVTGVGQHLKGIKYNDAIRCANSAAKFLKGQEKCDLVICLSHLGHTQPGNMPDTRKLAAQSGHIDMIVSGRNRQILAGPRVLLNKLKNEVLVTQAAWDGLMLSKTVFRFESDKRTLVQAEYFIAGQPRGQTFWKTYSGLREMTKQAV